MTVGEPRRGYSVTEMYEIRGRLQGPDDVATSIAAYRPRSSDVVITPFAKCGTTWLQQIFHCLRTGGDMDFDDISRVVPWIETSVALGLDLEAPQRAEPRGFKSHLAYTLVPKGARYIVALRDPRDALVSMYRFMEGWFLEPGAVTISEFAEDWMGRGAYWTHLLSWWEQRGNPAVLTLSYDLMNADPERAIRQVAAFCGLALDEDLLALTLERSGFAYMLAHKDRFDDLMMRSLSEVRCNLPPGSDSAKVRKGGSGAHRLELTRELDEALATKWREVVTPATGLADYAALEAELAARS